MKNNLPSISAAGVAHGIYLRSKHSVMRSYIDPVAADMAEYISKKLYRDPSNLTSFEIGKLGMFAASFLPDSLYDRLVNKNNYGMIDHYVMRKAAFESEIINSIEKDGAKQVVIIARGYDNFDLRLAKQYPDVKIFSIDHPATLRSSQNIINSKGFSNKFGNTSPSIKFIPLNLTDENADLSSILVQHGFDKSKLSITEAEGVLYYFPEKDISKTVSGISNISVEGSKFLLTMYRTPNPESKSAQNTDKVLKQIGEPYKTFMDRNELTDFAGKHGYEVIKTTLYHELQENLGIRSELEMNKLKNERSEDLYLLRFAGRSIKISQNEIQLPNLDVSISRISGTYSDPEKIKTPYLNGSRKIFGT